MTSSSSSVDRRSMPASMRTSHTRVRRRTHARTHTRRSVHRRGSIVFDSSVVAFVVRGTGARTRTHLPFQSPFARDGVRGLVDAARGAIDATCSGACSLARSAQRCRARVRVGDLAMSPFGHALCAQSAETEAVVVTRRWDARRDRADKRGRACDRANGDRATSRCGVWRQIRARDVWIGV